MRCDLVTTSVGRVLRDCVTGKIVFGPVHSYSALSAYLRENRIVIVERKDESAPASKGGGT